MRALAETVHIDKQAHVALRQPVDERVGAGQLHGLLLARERGAQAVVQPIHFDLHLAQRALCGHLADSGRHRDVVGHGVLDAGRPAQAHGSGHVLRRALDAQRLVGRQHGDGVQHLIRGGDEQALLRGGDLQQLVALGRLARHQRFHLQRYLAHRHQLGLHDHGVGEDRLVGDLDQIGFHGVARGVLQADLHGVAVTAPLAGEQAHVDGRHGARHLRHQRLRAGDGEHRRVGLGRVEVIPRQPAGCLQHDGHAPCDVALHVHPDARRLAGDDRAVKLAGKCDVQHVLSLARDLRQIDVRVVGGAAHAAVVALGDLHGQLHAGDERVQIVHDDIAPALERRFAGDAHGDVLKRLLAGERAVGGDEDAPEDDGRQQRERHEKGAAAEDAADRPAQLAERAAGGVRLFCRSAVHHGRLASFA